MNVIYKITYPNGKIYVGQNRTDSINYFGSANSDLIAQDFTREERRIFRSAEKSLGVRHRYSSRDDSQGVEFILALKANDPTVGYNRWPKFRP